MKILADRLKTEMKRQGFTQEALALASGVSQGTIYKLTSGKAKETAKIVQIANALGVSAEWLATGANPLNIADAYKADMVVKTGTRRSPIVGIAQMGDDGYWYENGRPVGDGDGYIEAISHDINCYSLEVRGDSMFPAIRDGWFVVVEPNTDPVPGEYVVVKTTDGRSMVKELLWNRGDSVSLQSVNDLHGRLSIRHEDIEFIHHVAFVAAPSMKRID